MAIDFLRMIREIRGSGEPEAEYTEEGGGIYYDLMFGLKNADGTDRLGEGVFGDIKQMHLDVNTIAPNAAIFADLNEKAPDLLTVYNSIGAINDIHDSIDEITALAAIETELLNLETKIPEITSLYADRAELTSVYNDKGTLDSLYADKVTLDSIFADKVTLDAISTKLAAIDTVNTNITKVEAIADNMADVQYFADVYQGPHAAEINLRNDGSTLLAGDLFFDTDVDLMKVRSTVNDWIALDDYVHPTIETTNLATSGANVVSSITTSAQGHITAMTERQLGRGDLAAAATAQSYATDTIYLDKSDGKNYRFYMDNGIPTSEEIV